MKLNPDSGDKLYWNRSISAFNLSLLALNLVPLDLFPSKGPDEIHTASSEKTLVGYLYNFLGNHLTLRGRVLSSFFFWLVDSQPPAKQTFCLKISDPQNSFGQGYIAPQDERKDPPLNQNKIKDKASAKKPLLKTHHKYLPLLNL